MPFLVLQALKAIDAGILLSIDFVFTGDGVKSVLTLTVTDMIFFDLGKMNLSFLTSCEKAPTKSAKKWWSV